MNAADINNQLMGLMAQAAEELKREFQSLQSVAATLRQFSDGYRAPWEISTGKAPLAPAVETRMWHGKDNAEAIPVPVTVVCHDTAPASEVRKYRFRNVQDAIIYAVFTLQAKAGKTPLGPYQYGTNSIFKFLKNDGYSYKYTTISGGMRKMYHADKYIDPKGRRVLMGFSNGVYSARMWGTDYIALVSPSS